jgi:uncharacterized phage-associated protein
MQTERYNRIELLALVKAYNKTHGDKIKNVDKLKKDEIIDICQQYDLLSAEKTGQNVKIDLRNVSKKDLNRDVEIFFMKKNRNVPQDVAQLKKQDLIDYIEMNDITHYTPELIEHEVKAIQHDNFLKHIISYNIIRYDNVDVMNLDNDNLQNYIDKNGLDTNIDQLQAYATLLHNLHTAYETFCKTTQTEYVKDKIKTIPKMLDNIKDLC